MNKFHLLMLIVLTGCSNSKPSAKTPESVIVHDVLVCEDNLHVVNQHHLQALSAYCDGYLNYQDCLRHAANTKEFEFLRKEAMENCPGVTQF